MRRVWEADDNVCELIGALNVELGANYSPEQQHGLKVSELFSETMRFFVAYVEQEAVGCGGVAFCEGFAEVKRMYVRHEFRGKGIAETLIDAIERTAGEAGYEILRLETGVKQYAAIAFYEKLGFKQCAVFEPYSYMTVAQIETSLFYEKKLVLR